jgi:DDE superfamily endonuclease
MDAALERSCPCDSNKIQLKGCVIIVHDQAITAALGTVAEFRQHVYNCLTRRRDAVFDLIDALACHAGPVSSLPALSLEPEFRRGHGALYSALADGGLDEARVRELLLDTVPAGRDGLVWFAGDVSGWPRPDAATSPQRVAMFDKSARTAAGHPITSGWPFAVMVGVEWGATSWVAPVDAVRLGPADTLTGVTLAAIERVVAGLAGAGRAETAGFVFDAEYDLMAISHRWAGRAHVVGRLRSNQVFHADPGPEPPRRGRCRRHGEKITLNVPGTLGSPDRQAEVDSPRYGRVRLSAWDGRHRRLTREGFWDEHPGALPIVRGSVIRVELARLPGGGVPDRPMWLWHAGPVVLDLVSVFAAYQRRFDIEHFFRFCKQWLGWTRPAPMLPGAAGVWTWVVLVVYTLLRLARPVVVDARLPWERPVEPGVLSPGRVRRDFRRVHAMVGSPARAPRFTRAGPGRPVGTSRPPRERYPTHKKNSRTNRKKGTAGRRGKAGKTTKSKTKTGR